LNKATSLLKYYPQEGVNFLPAKKERKVKGKISRKPISDFDFAGSKGNFAEGDKDSKS